MSRSPPRLYVDMPLRPGAAVALSTAQVHHLKNVMRLHDGDGLTLFNGRDGEWGAVITALHRQAGEAEVQDCRRPQPENKGPRLVFAPVKKTGVGIMVEKATELGAARLSPVYTAFTDIRRIDPDHLRVRATLAAEQCGRLDVPEIDAGLDLQTFLEDWPPARPLVVADETGGGVPVLDALASMTQDTPVPAFVIGPQGGFSKMELASFAARPFVIRIDLGPRLLRSETAAVAVLTCWQAARGDWIA
jgi:16S rRNA (uracil1498-N3)-methyltransferase